MLCIRESKGHKTGRQVTMDLFTKKHKNVEVKVDTTSRFMISDSGNAEGASKYAAIQKRGYMIVGVDWRVPTAAMFSKAAQNELTAEEQASILSDAGKGAEYAASTAAIAARMKALGYSWKPKKGAPVQADGTPVEAD